MPKWNDQRNKVKDIFDAIRNFALSGLVFYIGVYNLNISSPFAPLTYMTTFIGISMILLACYLYWLNYSFFNKIVREEHLAGNVGSWFYHIFPSALAFLGVALLFNSTLSIELESGKTLGKTTINETLNGKKEEPANAP